MVRAWAWALGALSFLAPWGLLGLSPKPVSAAPASPTPPKAGRTQRPVVVVVTKKIVYTKSASSSVSTTGGGPVTYVSAPATSAVAASCATPPC